MQARGARAVFRTKSCLRLRYCRFSSTIPGFAFYPDFFDVKEQSTLLHACLGKLDTGESRRMRRRREQYLAAHRKNFTTLPECSQRLADHFLPDDLYQFEEVSLGALHHYPIALI